MTGIFSLLDFNPSTHHCSPNWSASCAYSLIWFVHIYGFIVPVMTLWRVRAIEFPPELKMLRVRLPIQHLMFWTSRKGKTNWAHYSHREVQTIYRSCNRLEAVDCTTKKTKLDHQLMKWERRLLTTRRRPGEENPSPSTQRLIGELRSRVSFSSQCKIISLLFNTIITSII